MDDFFRPKVDYINQKIDEIYKLIDNSKSIRKKSVEYNNKAKALLDERKKTLDEAEKILEEARSKGASEKTLQLVNLMIKKLSPLDQIIKSLLDQAESFMRLAKDQTKKATVLKSEIKTLVAELEEDFPSKKDP